MEQLKMYRDGSSAVIRELPDGYIYEEFGGTEAEITDWLSLCNGALLPDSDRHWFYDTIVNYPDLVPENDLIFVKDTATGARIATSASVYHPAKREGYIHMVAASPAVRGKGIGHAMLSYAIAGAVAHGCDFISLTTDDFRLAAIKTYLDAGFRPVIYDDREEMLTRWNDVLRKMNYTLPGGSSDYIYE